MRAFDKLTDRQQAAELRRIKAKAEAHIKRNPQGPACFLPKEQRGKWQMAIY